MANALAALPPTDDPLWSIVAANIGEAVASSLADPTRLIDVSRRLADIFVSERCDAILGASPLGDRLAGAVASRHGVRVFDGTALRVLVVDGVLATGAALSVTFDELRQLGVAETRAAVVIDLGATSGWAGGHSVVEA